MSLRSVAKLSRVGASPTRSAINSRSNGSLFRGVNEIGVRAHSRNASSPVSVSV